MKISLCTQKSSSPDFRRTVNQLTACLMLGVLIHVSSLSSASAGTFTSDFNAGLPVGTTVFGNATNDLVGGFTNSGTIKLTTTGPSQTGSFVITNDLDAGQPVVSFTAKFKALIGGGNGADGFSFSFAPDLPFNATGEEGAGTGLTVSFDTYSQTGDTTAPEIEVRVSGGPIATTSYSAGALRAGVFVDVVIQLNPDGTLNVIYDGVYAHTNLSTGLSTITGGFFGFGARTGGLNDNHFIDDLSITTHTNAAPFVDHYSPIGRNVRPDAAIQIVLSDSITQVDPNRLVLVVDGAPVVPSVTQSAPYTTVSFQSPAIFGSNSAHTVKLTFADNAAPTPNTNTWEYAFTVTGYTVLDSNLVAPASLVSTNPGFTLRVSQIEVNLGPTIQRAENQLAGLLVDPNTSLPYPNVATPNPEDSSFTYILTNTINMSVTGNKGNFTTDDPMPGLPGTTANSMNVAMDAVAYLYLNAGSFYALGVNSSDGFRLTAASNPDLFAREQAQFNAVRAAANTTVTFAVAQSGYYPFRIVHFVGGVEIVNPSAGDPSLEFFSVDTSGLLTLVNDTNVVSHVPAFRAAQTLPYIRSVSPSVGETSVPRNTSIEVELIDGTITVDTNTIELRLNNAIVTPTITTNGAGLVSVHYQPPAAFSPNSTNALQIAFTDSAASRRTNWWQFVAENILTALWTIPPTSATNATWAKWVNSGGFERGIAYNPKTGHVLLVSRGAATGADGPNGAGIAVLDGNTGLYLKQLDKGSGIISGGLFIVNMIDVAEDGAIYVCSLTTSATTPFKIYRWQDEDSTPTVAFGANPNTFGGPSRLGDDFAVRGSGAGTQIIVSGNAAVATVPIFTTVDGMNFTVAVLAPTGLPNASVRLGLAWGCGNTFYGKTTGAGNDLRYVSFTGLPSTAGTLTASYPLLDGAGNPFIGPIGVDIINQRLIGDATSGTGGAPHSMNLYDLNALAPNPTVNNPVDSKPFAVNVGTFGTGAVDFTPDGSRVYTLDSGSGAIAFNLAPKVATPSICAQPQNHVVAGPGSLGFMDVMAIGAPQKFQWRFNGLPIANATNRTLDISDVQPAKLGFYSVIISNVTLGLSVTSTPAYLDTRMVFPNGPASQVVAVGSTANFVAGVSNGLPAYTYQWRLNGTNIASATQSSLTVNTAQAADAGGYTVVVTDSLGQVATSHVATLIVGTLGTGTGLTGDYYSSQLQTFTGPPALTRVDSTVDFDFGTGSPDPSISVDQFTIRWTGQVQPFYSQTYTFYTTTDDGVRLWVNGQLLVNSWIDQGPTERSGTIVLTANQKYDITMEYYENAVGAVARLAWSSPSQLKGIIPQTQLYPGNSPVQPALTSSLNNGTDLILNWSGTFQLETSTNVAGPYVPIAGVTNSPYTNIIGLEPELYFRLLNQY